MRDTIGAAGWGKAEMEADARSWVWSNLKARWKPRVDTSCDACETNIPSSLDSSTSRSGGKGMEGRLVGLQGPKERPQPLS